MRFALALGLLVGLGAATASAELAQHGNLFIRFDGGISPRALPRSAPAPIAVYVEGTIRAPTGKGSPPLRRITIALNRAGHLNTTGLPTCSRRRVDAYSPRDALAVCGSALVGSGGVVARTALPNQSPTTVRADVLLFNSTQHGKPAILAHVHQTEPTPTTVVFVFEIRRHRGAFATVITGRLPPGLNRDGYLKSIFLQLERRYTFHGRPRSYLTAACAAPAGFPGATFPFAHASMTFEDGRTLSSTLVRSCKVR